jgi:hypothetical protein
VSCSSGKSPYTSKRIAKRAANLVSESGLRLKPYPCAECGRWHLATVKGGVAPRGSTMRPTPYPKNLTQTQLEELAARMRAERCPPKETP